MGTGKLVINLDVLFFNDLVMSLILLWATARFAGLPARFWRLAGSGVIGALYTIVLVLPVFRGLPVTVYVLIHVVCNIVVAVTMVRIAFGRLRVQKFLKTVGHFYLITFLAGGAALSIYFIAGSSPTSWIFGWMKIGNAYLWLYLVAAIITIIIGRYGWNLIKERLYKEDYHLTLRVWIGEQSVQFQGLLDTGNLLKDPLTQLSVIVIETKIVLELFPPEAQRILAEEQLDVIDKVDQLLHTSWFHRFRIIPYTSLGTEGGLFIGCKPDRVEIIGKEVRETKRVILALHDGQMDGEGDYQAILHPELLEAM